MSEMENGWYLRSDGYMTSECSYQRIGAMKSNRALDNHGKLVFVKFMGGNETDSRVYVPHPGTCKNIAPEYLDFLCSECGFVHYHSDENDTGDGNDWAFCPRCGKAVER